MLCIVRAQLPERLLVLSFDGLCSRDGGAFRQLAELPDEDSDVSMPALCSAALDPSAVLVESGRSQQQVLLVTTGKGDLSVFRDGQQAGLVRAVCWSIRDKSEARAACCEVHLVSLALPDSSSGPCQVTRVEVLQVGAQHARCALAAPFLPKLHRPTDAHYIGPCTADTLVSISVCCQLDDCKCVSAPSPEDAALQTSALPPFATLVEPAHDAVVLALQPEQAVADVSSHSALEALPQTQYVDMWHETGPDNVGGMGSEPGVAVYGYVCQATRQPLGSNSAAQPEAWSPGMAAPNSAAAQPASDVVGPGESEQAPAQQASGPDQQPQSLVGGAAMPRQTAVASRQPGSLPGQTKGLYEQSGASTPPDQLDQQPETGTLAPLPRQTNVVRCEPHRLAALQACEPQQCLLGLTDDVDCAVVAAAWDAQSCQASLEHISTVPALAYVAAGKVQRKFVLLGHPGSSIAAAVVESHKFIYLYRRTVQRQPYGESQVS
eukprot:jgi/Astpho2/1667/Aster-04101